MMQKEKPTLVTTQTEKDNNFITMSCLGCFGIVVVIPLLIAFIVSLFM